MEAQPPSQDPRIGKKGDEGPANRQVTGLCEVLPLCPGPRQGHFGERGFWALSLRSVFIPIGPGKELQDLFNIFQSKLCPQWFSKLKSGTLPQDMTQ